MLCEAFSDELALRRKDLMDMVGDDAIIIIPAAPERLRSRTVLHPYRQDSDFYYLTGFNEPEALMVLVPGRAQAEFILFCRDRDPERERWDGKRLGVERAPEWLGSDDAFPISDADDILPGLMEGRSKLYYTIGKDSQFDQRVMSWVNKIRARARAGVQVPTEFIALDPLLHEMRLIKSPLEVSWMRRAADISAAAHQRLMQLAHPGMYEYELEAELWRDFRRHDAWCAYNIIVAGGANALILHYIENNEALRDGQLCLVDAGAEYRSYAADISRTFPVNGRFTAAQRDLYEIVLAANEAAIDKVRVKEDLIASHDTSAQVITQGLVDLGILSGSVDGLMEQAAYREFYVHRVGHFLGLDTHDVGHQKVDGRWRKFVPGMVTTIEPGLYLGEQDSVPAEMRNIGIRVEDNILVTPDGPENLTQACPKTVQAVEEACRS